MKRKSECFKEFHSNFLIYFILFGLISIVCAGCGDSSSNNGSVVPAEAAVKKGTFVDSPVEGLSYQTESQSGVTDSEGRFEYRDGETITFSIGKEGLGQALAKEVITPVDVEVILGQALAKEVITPVDIVSGALDETNPTVINICRFLLSLDIDGDPDNGISISDKVGEALVDLPVDLSINFLDPSFEIETNPGIKWLFETLNGLDVFTGGIIPRVLISAEDALDHLRDTLSALPEEIPSTLGELWDMIWESDGADSDGDYLPDEVEEKLGTDPYDRDTDHDGLYDYNEIFGNGVFNDNAPIPDSDSDGIIAVLDPDDNNDGRNDGEMVDTDNDGIPNYLEYYGYTYNWMSGQFALWSEDDVKSDPSVVYYKTDPLQPSTDQDPYPDSMEVSGAYMDVSVKEPGNLPMVPAYPDIVVKLEGYAVTINEDITTSTGKSLSKGETWNAETQASYSHTDESNWEIGTSFTTTVKASLLDFGAEASMSMHANYGGSESKTYTVGTVKSQGGSSLQEEEWSTARSLNPTDSAHIKLFLKVYNYGTAVASNIIPTFTLRVGGRNIATFEQGNAQINLLEPGGVYPSASDVYWVVDSIDTGAGAVPISLTMNELRALETGAPVTLQLTQLTADVLRLSNQNNWENVGNWNAYMARFDAVCSKLFVDIGDGNAINYLVYSDDSPSAPKVTLRDVLLWVAGGKADAQDQKIQYYDRVNNNIGEKSLDGWDILVDGTTWDANKKLWDKDGDGQVDADFNLLDVVLGPDTAITAKVPHDPDLVTGRPEIHYAYFDEVHNLVCTYISDYYGIKSVKLYLGDPDDPLTESIEMHEDYTGTGYYSTTIPPDYEWQENEVVKAGNVRAYKSDPPDGAYMSVRSVEMLYAGPIDIQQRPLIRWVKLDHNELTLTAEVDAQNGSPVKSVYLDLLESSEDRIELQRIADRTNVWACHLPDGYHTPECRELVIATNERGFATSSEVTDRINVRGAGYANLLYQQHEYYKHTWRAPMITGFDISSMLQVTANYDWWFTCKFGPWEPNQDKSTPGNGEHPSYLVKDGSVDVFWGSTDALGLEVNQADWGGLTQSDLVLMLPVMYGDLDTPIPTPQSVPATGIQVGTSIVSYNAPHLIKATIESIAHEYTTEGKGWINGQYDHYDHDHTVTLTVRYVIFAPESE